MATPHASNRDQSQQVRTEVTTASDPRWCCEQLEAGQILVFPQTPIKLSTEDRDFLLNQQQSDSSTHKNISYRPKDDVLRGFAATEPAQVERLHRVLRDFSQQSVALLTKVLAPYANRWKLDFASFRPIEEEGRDLPPNRRNDLMHVDAFPTRPTQGDRILRFFHNVNPSQPRVWLTTRRFQAVAEHFAQAAGLDRFAREDGSLRQRAARAFAAVRRAMGMRAPVYSAYDRFMLQFHDYLKATPEFQRNWPQIRLEFPPNSTWMVFTDSVPHGVLSGRCAMEQTLIVPESALLSPGSSPRRVLENLCGRPLVHGRKAA